MTASMQLFCVANHEPTLARNLKRSPDIVSGAIPHSIIWNASAASSAYSDAMREAFGEILIFAHQDVYFPEGWFGGLGQACELLATTDPDWAVAGVFGVGTDGQFVGHLWDSALAAVCGGPLEGPAEVLSLDEVVLIVRRASTIAFDRRLPSFHLYGTDIVLEARRAGLKSYALDLPIIHNSKPVTRLDRSYVEAYRFMVAKWWEMLPWPTVIVRLERSPSPLFIRRLRLRYKGIFRRSTLFPMLDHPELKADELGFVRQAVLAEGAQGCDR